MTLGHANLPVLPTGIGEGDPCPACIAAGLVDPTTTYNTSPAEDPTHYLMASTDGQPLVTCDTCGAEYRIVDKPQHEHADVLRCVGMAS